MTASCIPGLFVKIVLKSLTAEFFKIFTFETTMHRVLNTKFLLTSMIIFGVH